MKLKKKKGFTLVELLVVIAILAILAAVSVVGYLGFTNKAKESNDISLTTQMNTILQGESTLEGANKTAHDAVLDLQENGLDVTKLTPTRNGYEFVYDLSQDKFFLLDGNDVVAPANASYSKNKADIYKFIGKDGQLSTEYSNYLKDDYVQEGTLKVSNGLDVGTNTNVTDIEYENLSSIKNTAVLRTNGGNLTINAPLDTIYHYGKSNKVEINSIAMESYHLLGEVKGNINLNSGHAVLEEEGQLEGAVIVTATTIGDSTTGYSVKVTDETGTNVSVAAENSEVSSKLDQVTSGTNTVITDPIDKEQSSGFAGGLGTEKSPYLISTPDQFFNINTVYSDKILGTAWDGNVKHFKQVNDLVFTKDHIYKAVDSFTGTYDGGNYSFIYDKSFVTKMYAPFTLAFDTVTFKNMNIVLHQDAPVSLICYLEHKCKEDAADLTYENVNFDSNGEILNCNLGNFGFYSRNYYSYFKTIRYINCTNNVSVNNFGAATGVLTGGGFKIEKEDVNDTKVIIKNFVNNGNITGTQLVGLLYGNTSNNIDGLDDSKCFEIENLVNNGNLLAVNGAAKNTSCAFAPERDTLKEIFASEIKDKGTYLKSNYFDGIKDIFVDQQGINFSTNVLPGENIKFQIGYNFGVVDNTNQTVSNTTCYIYDIGHDEKITGNHILKHKAYDLEKARAVFGDAEVAKFTYDSNGVHRFVKDNVGYVVFKDRTINRVLASETPGETTISFTLFASDINGQILGLKKIG